MKKTIVGYPRIGENRELKFALEKYFKNKITTNDVINVSKEIMLKQWKLMKDNRLTEIPSNDFSFYDQVLDQTVVLGLIPNEYKELKLNELDTYFAMARGYQTSGKDVKAYTMKKWFNTNYHYLVPEYYDYFKIQLNCNKILSDYNLAKSIDIDSRSVIIGGFTYLKLTRFNGTKNIEDVLEDFALAYKEILNICYLNGIKKVQFDEPILVTDLDAKDISLFKKFYEIVLADKKIDVLIQTYFGDVRDAYEALLDVKCDSIGLDFIEGKANLELIKRHNVNKVLYGGIVNGKNIWKNDYKKTIDLVKEIKKYASNVVISTSCSLLHVPYTIKNETDLDDNTLAYFAFAAEKLNELNDLSILLNDDNYLNNSIYIENQTQVNKVKKDSDIDVIQKIEALKESDFNRKDKREIRQVLQRKYLGLPLLPTTTIGSFPQTKEVKLNRANLKKGLITKEEYDNNVRGFIKDCIDLQNEVGLDVLVHGEFERNDMVEYFGENLTGYILTKNAWVQSYGIRCVKPPVIFTDIKREKPITVETSSYAASLTNKPVKGMLTGPVTILNWSFPREDISLEKMCYQIALAIKEEVNDLEKAGIKVIQIDEAALREKLPLRRNDWNKEYLDWAIKAFRLVHSSVSETTQIHTHMCYSEFSDIIKEIDQMDADVITFETAKSSFDILDSINDSHFETEVGPGVYDIHSPRIPSVLEFEQTIKMLVSRVNQNKLWINPDCGLKTRDVYETKESLKNLVIATKAVREEIK